MAVVGLLLASMTSPAMGSKSNQAVVGYYQDVPLLHFEDILLGWSLLLTDFIASSSSLLSTAGFRLSGAELVRLLKTQDS